MIDRRFASVSLMVRLFSGAICAPAVVSQATDEASAAAATNEASTTMLLSLMVYLLVRGAACGGSSDDDASSGRPPPIPPGWEWGGSPIVVEDSQAPESPPGLPDSQAFPGVTEDEYGADAYTVPAHGSTCVDEANGSTYTDASTQHADAPPANGSTDASSQAQPAQAPHVVATSFSDVLEAIVRRRAR